VTVDPTLLALPSFQEQIGFCMLRAFHDSRTIARGHAVLRVNGRSGIGTMEPGSDVGADFVAYLPTSSLSFLGLPNIQQPLYFQMCATAVTMHFDFRASV
jgi:hypothetical protein